MQIDENLFGYWLLIIFASHAYIPHVICMCTRVAATAEEVVYEVVVEPPEPLEQAQQEERREALAQGQVHTSSEQQTQGKPRCTSYYFKL